MSGRSRSVSLKRKKSHSSSQENSVEGGQGKSLDKKKKKASEQTKETILAHFGKSVESVESVKMSMADMEADKNDDEQTAEPTNRDIMRLLKTMDVNLNKKLDTLSETVENLKGDVFVLQQENERLKAELNECKKREDSMQRKTNEAVFEAKLSHEKSERNEQYSRRNNIELLYIEESGGRFESAEESEEKALRVFQEKLGLRHIKGEDIEAAHRIGKKEEGHTRPIIVKFVSRKTKKEVIQNRKKLKNSSPKVVIVEDLTKEVYTLFRMAADHPGTLRCWTTEGKVYAQDTDSKVHHIKNVADLSRKLSIDAPTPSTSALPSRQLYPWRGRWQALHGSHSPSSSHPTKSPGGGPNKTGSATTTSAVEV